MFEVGELEQVQSKLDETKKRLQKEAKETGGDALKKAFAGFFKQFPEVEKVSWTQYTPHFNDGDPCEFGVNSPSFKIKGAERDDGHGGFDSWGLGYYKEKGKLSVSKELVEAAAAVSKKICGMKDVLEAAFGDHAEVVVTPTEITVEEYSHD